ncbi:MAG: dihydroorotase [Clostridiales bacterium]|nr:dihydroorotase [Clostridiales bacterium]
MNLKLKGANVYVAGTFKKRDLFVTNDCIYSIGSGNEVCVLEFNHGEIIEKKIDSFNNISARVIDLDNSFILPSFCDVHVHFREPGYEYKETIKTGSQASARGGYTTVCTMPNLIPAPVDKKTLDVQLEAIKKDAVINVIPYGAITANQSGRGELSRMREMADYVVAYTDDGLGVQTKDLMKVAMHEAKSLGKIIVAHCEDEEILARGDVRKSEWKQIERDVMLSEETGCPYHVCHVSTKESVEIIREARKSNIDVTCETAPHYLMLNDEKVDYTSGSYKMNPPIKTELDRKALIEGINDGTIGIIATDHAPHSKAEKARGFEGSLNGIVGLETAFSTLYSNLVLKEEISFETLIKCMAANPRKRFDIKESGLAVVILMKNI